MLLGGHHLEIDYEAKTVELTWKADAVAARRPLRSRKENPLERDSDARVDIVAEFTKRGRRQLIAIVPFLVAVFLLFMLQRGSADGYFGIAAIAIGPVCVAALIAVAIFWRLNWRCPACRSYLGKSINPIFCQTCGAKLQA